MLSHSQSGALDFSFGDDGIVTTEVAFAYSFAHVIQPDGKIIVAGNAGNPSFQQMAVARFYPDGSLDETFGDNGTATYDLVLNPSFANGLVLLTDGKILVTGYTFSDFVGDFAAIRLNADGSLDTSFGTDGVVIVDNGGSEVSESMVLLEDESFIIVGYPK